MFMGMIFTLFIGGIFGYWFGSTQTRNTCNQRWMEALEQARLDSLINEEQMSEIIKIQKFKQ